MATDVTTFGERTARGDRKTVKEAGSNRLRNRIFSDIKNFMLDGSTRSGTSDTLIRYISKNINREPIRIKNPVPEVSIIDYLVLNFSRAKFKTFIIDKLVEQRFSVEQQDTPLRSTRLIYMKSSTNRIAILYCSTFKRLTFVTRT